MIIWEAKDPNEIIEYVWEPPLTNGDHIDSYTIAVVAGTVTIVSDDNSNTAITAFINGGADGEVAQVLMRATTTRDHVYEETALIQVAATDAPGLAEFKAIFPAFAAVPDAAIEFWLGRATPEVGDDWGADADLGRYYLAAHYMTLNGIGTSSEAQTAGLGAKRLKSGAFEIELGASADAEGLKSTNYGRQFMALLRRHRGAMVTGTGTWPVRRTVTPWGY